MAVLSKPQIDLIQEMISDSLRVYFTQGSFPSVPPDKRPANGAAVGTVSHIATFDGVNGLTDSGVKLTTSGGESNLQVDGNDLIFSSKLSNGDKAHFKVPVALLPGQVNDISSGGDIGTAALTVDILPTFQIDQTTGGQTLTLPSPTETTACKIVTILNVGSVSFAMLGKTVNAGDGLLAQWNGSSWALLGA